MALRHCFVSLTHRNFGRSQCPATSALLLASAPLRSMPGGSPRTSLKSFPSYTGDSELPSKAGSFLNQVRSGACTENLCGVQGGPSQPPCLFLIATAASLSTGRLPSCGCSACHVESEPRHLALPMNRDGTGSGKRRLQGRLPCCLPSQENRGRLPHAGLVTLLDWIHWVNTVNCMPKARPSPSETGTGPPEE